MGWDREGFPRTIAAEAESDDGEEELHAAKREEDVDHVAESRLTTAMVAIGSLPMMVMMMKL